MHYISLKIAFIATFSVMFLGCSPQTANRGHLPPTSQLDKLKVGMHSKEYVKGLLGTPSTVGTFDRNVWYYIGRRTEKWAFFKQSVLDQQIVAIYFDPKGKIEHIQKYNKADMREIDIVDGKTPTSGRKLGVFEQIFGNLGRFNHPKSIGDSRY